MGHRAQIGSKSSGQEIVRKRQRGKNEGSYIDWDVIFWLTRIIGLFKESNFYAFCKLILTLEMLVFVVRT